MFLLSEWITIEEPNIIFLKDFKPMIILNISFSTVVYLFWAFDNFALKKRTIFPSWINMLATAISLALEKFSNDLFRSGIVSCCDSILERTSFMQLDSFSVLFDFRRSFKGDIMFENS